MSRTPKKKSSPKKLRWFVLAAVALCVAALGFGFSLYSTYLPSVPQFTSVKDYKPKLGTRIYSADYHLIGEFAAEARALVRYEQIPPLLFKAFMAAEDQRFLEHRGLDFVSIVQALAEKILHPKRKLRGASTITQQVAKSLLATHEDYESATARTLERKIREAILARRLEKNLTKEDILYIYVNQIFLGHKAYGVQAASQHYFRKNVWELTLAEMAMLAGLPQRPSDYSPVAAPEAALKRRKYVLERMLHNGFIEQKDFDAAVSEPLNVFPLYEHYLEVAPYYTEQVRQFLITKFGEQRVLENGFEVVTPLNMDYQLAAEESLDNGLNALDKRQGFRGPLITLEPQQFETFIRAYALSQKITWEKNQRYLGLVKQVEATFALLDVAGVQVTLPLAMMRWARTPDPTVRMDNAFVTDVRKVLHIGDVVFVAAVEEFDPQKPVVRLEQEPLAEGALLSVNPNTGEVLALVGGNNFLTSSFNRVFQACREPGSAFKPIVYTAALEELNDTPSTLIEDKPIVFEDPENAERYKPNNAGAKFRGSLPLRTCLQDSINTAAIRLTEAVGIDNVIAYAKRFGITTPLKRELGTALGSSCTTLADLIQVYIVLNQYGIKRELQLISSIRDQEGKLLEDFRTAEHIELPFSEKLDRLHQQMNTEENRVLNADTAFIMVSMLKNAVQNGTGSRASHTGFEVAGKTGTTNDSYDAWFMGFTKNLVSGVWVGHDKKERPLGVNEEGGKTAAPIWAAYTQKALTDYTVNPPQKKPEGDFLPPLGVVQIAIDPQTGLLARPGNRSVLEYYKIGTEPTEITPDKTLLNPEQMDVFGADEPL